MLGGAIVMVRSDIKGSLFIGLGLSVRDARLESSVWLPLSALTTDDSRSMYHSSHLMRYSRPPGGQIPILN